MDVRVITAAGVEQRSTAELPALLKDAAGIVWVDVPSCDSAAERVLSDVFGFHPIAVRDCVVRNRVPKVHVYPDHIFLVLHTPQHGRRGHVHYVELDQFIGPNYVVTVHGPVNPLVDPEVASRETREVLQRIENRHVTLATPCRAAAAGHRHHGPIRTRPPYRRRRTGVPARSDRILSDHAEPECDARRAGPERGGPQPRPGRLPSERGRQEDLRMGGNLLRTEPLVFRSFC